MAPKPARIAATPSPSSRASWNPAVPPPPVGGAAVGNGLGDGLGDGDVDAGDGDREGLGDGLGVSEGLALALGEALGEALALGLALAEALGEAEDVGSAPEDVADVQAERVTEASMAKMPPTAASLALNPVPAGVVRTFMEPPHAPGKWQPGFPDPASETHIGREIAWPTRSLPAPTARRSVESAGP
jgi:hypothetical protein